MNKSSKIALYLYFNSPWNLYLSYFVFSLNNFFKGPVSIQIPVAHRTQ